MQVGTSPPERVTTQVPPPGLSVKVTVPVGMVPPFAGVTVALNVVVWLTVGELGVALTLPTVTPVEPTVTGRLVELAPKLLSPV